MKHTVTQQLTTAGRRYGDRSETSFQAAKEPPTERKPAFAQPDIRTTHYERDEFGIVSPSDLRRPSDASHVKIVGKFDKQETARSHEAIKTLDDSHTLKQKALKSDAGQQSTQQVQFPVTPEVTGTVADEASKQESSFIDAFFAADEAKVCDRDSANSKSWRQTALQRRATSNIVTRPRTELPQGKKHDAPATDMTSAPVRETFVIPSSQALVDNFPYPRPSVSKSSAAGEEKPQLPVKEVERSVPEPSEVVQEMSNTGGKPSPALSTSTKLESLPQDDIDFLSAEEIRAAMGRRKNGIKSNEERMQERQKLEAGYVTAEPKALDEIVEGHVLNNFHVRRTLQELERAQTAQKEPKSNDIETQQKSTQPQPGPAQIESSIDRMRRWIEEGGTSFAKHFWQDPVEAGAPSEADMQFARQMAGLGKSRRAREHISDDLENDLPMSKGLLERLKNDENRVEHAVYLLRTPRKVVHGTEISKNLRTIRERRLRNTYERTEKQFEAACQSLRDLDAEVVQKASNAFKRRLGIASRVLHKNHTLTRMLTWSARARLDEPGLERGKAELYSEILTRLATLRDAQLALARLMDHAIQIYGVSLQPADEALSRTATKIEAEAAEEKAKEEAAAAKKLGAKFLADTAVAARLADEVESQKAAMKGLSDDGYARAPKPTQRKLFEETNPLAHSLFRPFNHQFESLGKKTEGEEAEENLKQAFKQKIGDRKLVQEVRSAYEDTYGPITVEHRQVPQAEESATTEAKETKAFKMLKEDPVSQTATIVHEELPVRTASTSEPPLAQSETQDAEAGLKSTEPSQAIEAAMLETPSPPIVKIEEPTKENSQSTPSSLQDATSSVAASEGSSTRNVPAIDLPTHYTILVHDPQTDALSITTSTSGPPRDTSPALPIHQALSSLKAPAKFIPYISPGLEIVTAKRHMLVLRDALDESPSIRGFETIIAQPSAGSAAELPSSEINPIDGTTRLSPTGYSGVEQNREQIERDFEERRQAAAAAETARSKWSKQQSREEDLPKKKGIVGGVVKTAIWASAVCYIVGVTAELLR